MHIYTFNIANVNPLQQYGVGKALHKYPNPLMCFHQTLATFQYDSETAHLDDYIL